MQITKTKPTVMYLVGTLEAGGLERFVARTALRAVQTGVFSPVVCCLRAKTGLFVQELEAAGVPVYGLASGWERSLQTLLRLGRLIRDLDVDLVHSQVNYSLLQQLFAVRWSGRAAFCVTQRNLYLRTGWARLRQDVQFHLLRLARVHYSANSQEGADHLATQVRVRSETIPVLPNGVYPIPDNPTMKVHLRRQFGCDGNEVVIGCVARIAEVKRPILFVEVISKLLALGAPVRAIWVGDGPERDTMNALIASLGLADKIVLTGVVKNVEDYLQAMDIFILLSVREGMPNAILEAMSAGRAIVATGVGGIPTLLDNGGAGLMVASPTPDNVVEKIKMLLDNPTLRVSMGNLARNRAQEMFGIERIFEDLSKYYYRVLSININDQHS